MRLEGPGTWRWSRMAQSDGQSSKKRIVVSSSEVAAAKLKIERAKASGRAGDSATQAIRDPKKDRCRPIRPGGRGPRQWRGPLTGGGRLERLFGDLHDVQGG